MLTSKVKTVLLTAIYLLSFSLAAETGLEIANFAQVIQKCPPHEHLVSIDVINQTDLSSAWITKVENIFIHYFLTHGYAVTPANHLRSDLKARISITNFVETDLALHITIEFFLFAKNNTSPLLTSSLTLPLAKTSLFHGKFVGDLTMNAGGEMIPEGRLDIRNKETRTSSIHKRDVRVGIHVSMPQNLSSDVLIRTRTSFGRDDFYLYKVTIQSESDAGRFTFGHYHIQLGRGSRYLNASIERPYWESGLFFDSQMTGLSAQKRFKQHDFSLYAGCNRNPSVMIAGHYDFTIKKTSAERISARLSAVFVDRDDIYNDLGHVLGFELIHDRHDKLYFYLLAGLRRYYGIGANQVRQVRPLLVECEVPVVNRWSVQGTCFTLHEQVESGKNQYQTMMQGKLSYRLSDRVHPAIQAERFSVNEYQEWNYSALLQYVLTLDDAKNDFKMSAYCRTIVPEIGRRRYAVLLEGRIRF
ncbi:hypothetical protein EH223_07450 [candidate division KSB1 bacterium]|nr:hypothetical protein [candidate division KSB1 bacterium]RQW04381.1 MAG: hypothetical protein EH223_07450 [candidate division KSB1 bacterium]